jgi:uncharacterized protein YndB with AHSA1/START domain
MIPGPLYGHLTAKSEMTFSRLLPGPIERVWEYLTNSEKRGKWLASGEVEGRVGGRMDLHFRQCDLSEEKEPPAHFAHLAEGTHMTGTVTRYQPLELLGFTWRAGAARSEVIFRLKPADRQVRLILTHRHLTSPEAMRNAAAGWHTHLDLLLALLEGDTMPPYWSKLERLKDEYGEIFPEE